MFQNKANLKFVVRFSRLDQFFAFCPQVSPPQFPI